MDPEEILAVGRVATQGAADLVVILDVDTETAATRLPAQLDRWAEGDGVPQAGPPGLSRAAERDPARHLVIDGSRTEDEVFRSLLEGGARLSTIVAAESAGWRAGVPAAPSRSPTTSMSSATARSRSSFTL